MKRQAKQSREQRLESLVRNEIETARGHLQQADQQIAELTKRRDELAAFIAEREELLKV